MKPLKISIIIDAFTQGGAQKVLLALVPEWVSQGHAVQIVLIQNSNRELDLDSLTQMGVRIERVSSQSMFDFFALFRLWRVLKVFKPVVLQCHLYWSPIWGGILKVAIPRIELVWVEHNMYFNRTHPQWLLYRLLSRLTKDVIAVSVEVTDFLHTHHLRKARFVPNPVSRAYGVSEEISRENLVAFVGRFNEQKNPMLAIKAFEFAIRSLAIPPDSKLMMVGNGHLDSELKDYVRTRSSKLAVLFTGFLSESELSKLLKQTRVLISTSLHEGCPLVRLEAAASGCTIVTTATGGIKGILSRDYEGVKLLDGVFVVETEILALSSALAEAFSPKLWTPQHIVARSKAMWSFRPEVIATSYLAG